MEKDNRLFTKKVSVHYKKKYSINTINGLKYRRYDSDKHPTVVIFTINKTSGTDYWWITWPEPGNPSNIKKIRKSIDSILNNLNVGNWIEIKDE